jgi:hypothetical protein
MHPGRVQEQTAHSSSKLPVIDPKDGLLPKVVAAEILPEVWREYFLRRLDQLAGSISESEI